MNHTGLAVLLAFASVALMSAADFTGVITDDMCDKADHKGMNMGPDAKCVAVRSAAGSRRPRAGEPEPVAVPIAEAAPAAARLLI